jgi:hypothetical protein
LGIVEKPKNPQRLGVVKAERAAIAIIRISLDADLSNPETNGAELSTN